MSTLYLIRHAQASFGSSDYDRLSDLGRKQAGILAAHFHQLGISFDAIYTGLQLRHAQTLAAYTDLCANTGTPVPPVRKNAAFNEYNAENVLKTVIPVLIEEDPAFEKDVEQMTRDNRSFQKVFEKALLRWARTPAQFDGLDNWRTYSENVCGGIEAVMNHEGAGRTVAVFTSGGPIAATVQKALQLSVEHTLKLSWQIVNTSVTRLKYSGSRIMLFSFNDFVHLEMMQEPGLVTYR